MPPRAGRDPGYGSSFDSPRAPAPPPDYGLRVAQARCDCLPPAAHGRMPRMSTIAPPPPATAAWHSLPADQVLALLGTSRENGLTAAEAAARLARHGLNRVAETERASPWRLLFEQFKNVLVLILLVKPTGIMGKGMVEKV